MPSVRVPSVEAEDARRSHRERQRLVRERTGHIISRLLRALLQALFCAATGIPLKFAANRFFTHDYHKREPPTLFLFQAGGGIKALKVWCVEGLVITAPRHDGGQHRDRGTVPRSAVSAKRINAESEWEPVFFMTAAR